jgi:hypothetical protein
MRINLKGKSCLSIKIFLCLFLCIGCLSTGTTASSKAEVIVISKDIKNNGLLAAMGSKRILFLKGTPEQMGTAHGNLLKADISKMTKRIFLVGGAYSVKKNDWFFTRIDEVKKRTSPYTPKRFIAECDAMSKAAGITVRDGRNANFFPEMFHCSGAAVYGKATTNGQVIHARVLDYMSNIGLQEVAAVMVHMPDGYNKWLNLSFATFIGTVTAMNEKGLAMGELGGRGEGNWDGMPMSFLMREIMEKASNVKEAVNIIKNTKLTCEYYYILSDKSRNIVGLYCTPDKVEILEAGKQHERLPHIPENTIYLSGGKRVKLLGKRINENYGKIDVGKMIEIIRRPVAMKSNLHNAVFLPETLDMFFADAGKNTPACNNPYEHVNLKKLLEFYKKAMAQLKENEKQK